MDPDKIVCFQDWLQRGCKGLVNPLVSFEVSRFEFNKIQPVVTDGPKHLVGKA